MSVPAGSKGGFHEPLRDTRVGIEDFASNLAHYMQKYRLSAVKSLGIYINSICNLACTHCYYQIGNGYRTAGGLSARYLIGALKPALGKDVILFAFVGKEIFLPGPNGVDKTFPVMRFLAKIRSRRRRLLLGAVTNGIFLDRFIEPIKEIELDFLDISFDGHNAPTHEWLRGKGTFGKSTANLAKAIAHGAAKRVFVATTLRRGNVDTLANILDFHERFGAQHFSVMPIVAVHDVDMAVSIPELIEFLYIHVPEKAASLNLKSALQFVMDIDAYVVQRAMKFFSSFFEGCTIKIDALDNILLIRELDHLQLVVRLSLPDPCNSYGCVTHDGLYFDKGGCLFMKAGYEAHALGNVANGRLGELLSQHERHAASCMEKFGSQLFAEPSDNLLNFLEETTFYDIPEMV